MAEHPIIVNRLSDKGTTARTPVAKRYPDLMAEFVQDHKGAILCGRQVIF